MRLPGVLALAAVSLLSGAPASNAAAVTGTPLAAIPNAALQLTADGGYAVFSQRDAAGKWQLMAWHDGRIAPVDAPERAVPFDADAGSSAHGTPTIVFSKCAHDPAAADDWGQAAGCHIYELALPDGEPTLVRGIYAPGASDTNPAISMGDIAFARLTRGARAPTLYLWSHASRRLSSVGAGPGTCQAYSSSPRCDTKPHVLAWVQEMSLDADSLAYQWALPETEEPGFGAAYAEIRLDPLHAGRQDAPSKVLFYSILGGACNGEEGGSPDAVGASVLYIWHTSACVEEPVRSEISSYSTAVGKGVRVGVSPGLAVAVAQDHRTTYWIRLGPKNPHPCGSGSAKECDLGQGYAQTCDPTISDCTLMRTEGLAGELRLG